MAKIVKLILRQPGYFIWPLMNSMVGSALLVFIVWMMFIEPRDEIVSEYKPPLVNGELADQVAVDITRAAGLKITRFYVLHRQCPMTVALSIDCDDGYRTTFATKSGGSGRAPGVLPPTRFIEPIPDDVPYNTLCEFHVQATSICVLMPHIDEMTPAKFRLLED